MTSEEPSEKMIELVCPSCDTRFRLKARRLPKKPIPCGRCGAPIPLNSTASGMPDAPEGVRPLGLNEVFGRSEVEEVERPAPKTPAPGEKARRVFRDVTTIDFDGSPEKKRAANSPPFERAKTREKLDAVEAEAPQNLRDTRENTPVSGARNEPASAESEEPRIPRAPENRRRSFTRLPAPPGEEDAPLPRPVEVVEAGYRELPEPETSPRFRGAPTVETNLNQAFPETPEKPSAESTAETPRPSGKNEPSPLAPIARPAPPSDVEAEQAKGTGESGETPQRGVPSVTVHRDQTAEVARASLDEARYIAARESWTVPRLKDALRNGVKSRAGQHTYGPLDRKALELLVRSDVYLDAIELELGQGIWVPMTAHPILPIIRESLRRKAQNLLRGVSSAPTAESLLATTSSVTVDDTQELNVRERRIVEREERARKLREREDELRREEENALRERAARLSEREQELKERETRARAEIERLEREAAENRARREALERQAAEDRAKREALERAEAEAREAEVRRREDARRRENEARERAAAEERAAANRRAEEAEREAARLRDEVRRRDEQSTGATGAVKPTPPLVSPPPTPPALSERDVPTRRLSSPLVIVTVLAMAALLVYVVQDERSSEELQTPLAPPREAIRIGLTTATRAQTLAKTTARLRQEPTEKLREEARAAMARADFGSALESLGELRRREPDSEALLVEEVRAMMGAQHWGEAREAIIAAYAEAPSPALRALFAEAVQSDATLRDRFRTIGADVQVDSITALGGGRSISFKLKRGDEKVFAFKPGQVEWEQGWRSEVAAWRLCQVLACGFEIPRSMSGRVSKDDFERLYPLDDIDERVYRKRFDELVWTTESAADGEATEYLHGVLKIWVPHFVDWPIEYTHIWEPWLNVDGDPVVLETPFDDAIRPLSIYKDGTYRRNILKERGQATTRSVARQLSNILVFDYLTNNWDRFSALENYYGVNNQFADGVFVSIDNGACFHLQSSMRVDARFEPVERMSRSLVASVRLLDRTWLDPILYPSPTTEERARLDVFWERREEFLARVDGLIAKHGVDAVLAFE